MSRRKKTEKRQRSLAVVWAAEETFTVNCQVASARPSDPLPEPKHLLSKLASAKLPPQQVTLPSRSHDTRFISR